MALPSVPLTLNEVGAFGELRGRPNPNGYVVFTVPAFEAMLPFLAQRLGRELSPTEIEVERQKAPSIVVSEEVALKMERARASRP